jgi:hypothetical protein
MNTYQESTILKIVLMGLVIREARIRREDDEEGIEWMLKVAKELSVTNRALYEWLSL